MNPASPYPARWKFAYGILIAYFGVLATFLILTSLSVLPPSLVSAKTMFFALVPPFGLCALCGVQTGSIPDRNRIVYRHSSPKYFAFLLGFHVILSVALLTAGVLAVLEVI